MKKNITIIFFALFACVFTFAQTKVELKKSAIKDAQAACDATLKKDFKKLLSYTHNNILKAAGGENAMVNYLESTFKQMEANGFEYLKAETKFTSDVVEEQGEFRCYVENYNEMKMVDKKIISTSYMLGFYNKKEKKWKFVEAKEMKSTGSIIEYFPNFETSLNIPENIMKTEDIKQ